MVRRPERRLIILFTCFSREIGLSLGWMLLRRVVATVLHTLKSCRPMTAKSSTADDNGDSEQTFTGQHNVSRMRSEKERWIELEPLAELELGQLFRRRIFACVLSVGTVANSLLCRGCCNSRDYYHYATKSSREGRPSRRWSAEETTTREGNLSSSP